ncbi:N-acetylmuramoyl-L-alanine amidase [Chryseomicrobium aureum]|uniref:N-acetylmuramoyl-L-alanine amidase n=1 Tax=Chryseomicrobium aureum TaxID=1441723 RepID=UPI00370DDC44
MPTVVIFAGHDHDTWEEMGAKGVRTDLEKDGVFEEFDSNYAIAESVVGLLRKLSKLKVLFPQESKKKMTLAQRTKFANDHNADLVIDIHSNAASTRTATGAAAFYWHNSSNGKRAALLYASLLKKHGLPVWQGGTYPSGPSGWHAFYMLKNTKMPAILLENFFFTTRSDLENYLLNPAVIKTLVEIVANTALTYFNMPNVSSATTVQTPLPDGHQVLRLGSSGSSVQYAQSRLNKRGFALTIDGHFGSLTENAVKKFQKDSGLVVDGIIGAATWKELDRDAIAVKPKPTPNKNESIFRVIVEGKQVGAYGDHTNIEFQVASALKSGKKKIVIEKV